MDTWTSCNKTEWKSAFLSYNENFKTVSELPGLGLRKVSLRKPFNGVSGLK